MSDGADMAEGMGPVGEETAKFCAPAIFTYARDRQQSIRYEGAAQGCTGLHMPIWIGHPILGRATKALLQVEIKSGRLMRQPREPRRGLSPPCTPLTPLTAHHQLVSPFVHETHLACCPLGYATNKRQFYECCTAASQHGRVAKGMGNFQFDEIGARAWARRPQTRNDAQLQVVRPWTDDEVKDASMSPNGLNNIAFVRTRVERVLEGNFPPE